MKQNTSNEKNLAKAIRACLSQKDMSMHDGATKLGLSYAYFASLLNGSRRFSGLSQDKQDRIAIFLGISKPQFFVLCGMLSPKDLLPVNNTDHLVETIQQIQRDPKFSIFMPSLGDLDNVAEPIKVLLAVLYGQVVSNKLQAQRSSVI